MSMTILDGPIGITVALDCISVRINWNACHIIGIRNQPGDVLPVEGEVCGFEVSRASARTLEAENARLKKLLAEAMLATRC